MRIQVLHTYGGKLTKREKIFEGVYGEDDPALFGLASYLLANGHAISLDAKQAPVTNIETPSPDPDIEFNRKLLGDRVAVQNGQLIANVPQTATSATPKADTRKRK